MSPQVAKEDTYGLLNTGGAEVRVQIKAGDPIPPGVTPDKGAKLEGEQDAAQERGVTAPDSVRKSGAKAADKS